MATMKHVFIIAFLLLIPTFAKADSFGNFTYQNGAFTTLSVPAQDYPVGIDNAGDVLMGEGNGTVIVNGNTVTSLNIPGEITVLPLAISPNGTVLGRAINVTSTYFSQTQGTLTLYPNAPGFLNGVNDNGQFVGTTFDGQKNFIYDAKTGSVTNISDGNSSFLKAINDNGAVLELTRNGTFIYKAGLFTPLVLPNGCSATAMNDIGTVVGNCFDAGSGSGFIDQNGFISYVNYAAPGNGDVFYTQLSGINDVGEVVGSFSDVPEPSSLASLLVGISALALVITLHKFLGLIVSGPWREMLAADQGNEGDRNV
jgi:hypothetical protein